MREIVEQAEVAYFHETRRQGLKTREAAERMGASLRKVADLASTLKQTFLRTETEHELPRRIEFWAEPQSEARIRQALRGAPTGAPRQSSWSSSHLRCSRQRVSR